MILKSKNELHLKYETCLQSIDLLDRVISYNKLEFKNDDDLLLLTYTCLMISVKFIEVNIEREFFKKTYSL